MGSISDLKVMQEAADVIKELGVDYEIDIVSAHRTPIKMVEYAQTARERGIKVIIAGAGGAAQRHQDRVAGHVATHGRVAQTHALQGTARHEQVRAVAHARLAGGRGRAAWPEGAGG